MPAFVYWLAGYLAINGAPDAPTIGDIVAFTTLQSRLFFPLGQLLNVQVEIQGALALFDRIFEYLEMDPEIVDAPDAVGLDHDHVRGRVRFRDVSFRYPTERCPRRAPTRPSDDGVSRGRRRSTRTSTAASEAGDVAVARPSRGRDRCGRADAEADDAGEAAARLRRRGRAASVPPPAFGLEDIDFEAEPGQLVALVGPSGSRQDDDDLPDPAAVRRRRRRGRDRRTSTSARSSSRRWARSSAS